MPDPARSRTLHPGQFRLTRLQVVNWGTFCGYKDFTIDERGVLLTGPSGSGKSSLIDAHSLVLLPTYDQRFNASADMTARGAKQGTRTVADYVRGAWSENDDEHDQSQVQYLRGNKPAWSAIAATYEDGLGAITTAVLVKWFTGTDTDGASLKTMHQLHDGHFQLMTLQEWADKEFDTRWFKAAHAATYPATQAAYIEELGDRVGLGTSKTALALLGKAKAMKNVGDLNMFIRDNMLDEPETFDAAAKMLAAFTPLNEAYETARRAHAQEQILRDVPANWCKYRESGETRTLAETLLGTPMEYYLRNVHLQILQAEIERIDKVVEELDSLLGRQEEHKNQKYIRFTSLDDQWRREGQVLQNLATELNGAKAANEARKSAYQIYSGYVARLEMPCPQDGETFLALRGQLPHILEQAIKEKGELGPQRHTKLAAAAAATQKHTDRLDELIALQSAKTLIPPREDRRRQYIARGTGVPVADLPYAAELIDIADGEERWRPAAEKVLRNYGLRLLVPERHKEAVRHFIDTNDMRGIVEYSIVTTTSAHQPRAHPDTLAGKLDVDTTHPSGSWLAAQLAKTFDHVCVESARDLERHRVAVTVRGTVKLPGNHYRKDDRPELTSPSSYILGANTVAKRAALAAEVEQLAEDKKLAVTEATELDDRYRSLDSIIDAANQLDTYISWIQLDHWASARVVHELGERIAAIEGDNVNLQQLKRQRDKAEREWEAAADDCSTTRSKITSHSQRQTDLVDTHEHEERKPHTLSNEDELAYLDEVYAGVEVPASPEMMPQIRSAFRKDLERRREAAAADRRLAFTRVKTAIDRFLEEWKDAAPDTSGDVDRCGADFAALYDDIAQRRLPEAMTRFQRMISEDMVPSIGVLQRAIEKAANEIQDRVNMVNAGLRRVEFNPDTHLQIAYKANPADDVKEFRAKVDTLLSKAPAARRDPKESLAQFRRVRDLMARFTADNTEGRRWRANVLDVRNSYVFYGREENADGVTVHTYRNTASNSGGEQEKLVAFCLAAALSYNLADPNSDGRPRFAPLMLDEAFSKSDEAYAAQALSVFDEFGFQLIMAAPIRMSGIVEPFIGQAVLVEKRLTPTGAHSNAASATFGELAVRRLAEIDGDIRASA